MTQLFLLLISNSLQTWFFLLNFYARSVPFFLIFFPCKITFSFMCRSDVPRSVRGRHLWFRSTWHEHIQDCTGWDKLWQEFYNKWLQSGKVSTNFYSTVQGANALEIHLHHLHALSLHYFWGFYPYPPIPFGKHSAHRRRY